MEPAGSRTIGGGYLNHTTPIGKDTLAMAIANFEKEIERVAVLYNSLAGLADRLVGTRPQPAGVDESASPATSLVDDLQRKRRRLSDMISACEVERDRIAQVLS